jgi:phage repressor protein C with HTH and peptisase S24 domain
MISKLEKLENAYNYLRQKGMVHTKKEFAQMLDVNYSNLTMAFSNSEKYLTNGILKKIWKLNHTIFNRDYFLGSDPNMLLDKNLINQAPNDIKTDSLTENKGTINLYDVEAAAGYGTFEKVISNENIIGQYVIPDFRNADFMIYVKGSSMYPKYSSGDIIACKILDESRFIQWGKVYVIATKEQGFLVKRIMASDKENYIKAVSDNESYPPFDIPKDEICGLALVMGVLRLE